MDAFDDTRGLFLQLGATAGDQAVKTLIENHDAWSHADAAQGASGWVPLAGQALDPVCGARVVAQRRRLESLVVRLRVRYASAS